MRNHGLPVTPRLRPDRYDTHHLGCMRDALLAALVACSATPGAASDLDRFCDEWEATVPASCVPIRACPPPALSTEGDYDVDFIVFQGRPQCDVPDEAKVTIINNNEHVQVRVARYGIAEGRNIYFQSDAPDEVGCHRSCGLETPHCTHPPCNFVGECCDDCNYSGATCPGAGTAGAGCTELANPNTCGCEVSAETAIDLTAASSAGCRSGSCSAEDGCLLPVPGAIDTINICDRLPQGTPTCAQKFDQCLMLSPDETNGIHFVISHVNFSDSSREACWLSLAEVGEGEQIRLDGSDPLVEIRTHEDCPAHDGANLRRICPREIESR